MSTPLPENQAAFSARDFAQLFGAETDVETRGVLTDSRAIRGGELFVALRGERLDAHRFLGDVANKGAAAAIVEEVRNDVALPQIQVGDSLVALGKLAHLHRTRWSGHLIGITGSAGKTTTKTMLASALGERHVVHKTAGNLNNRIGLPHVLFALEPRHSHAVIEMGTSLPGEIGLLAAIAGAQVGVVTLVAPVHTQGLGTLAEVAKEKCALLESIPKHGYCVWNTDVSVLERRAREVSVGTAVRYGEHERADVRLVAWQMLAEGGTTCTYQTPNGTIEVRLQLLGEAAVRNVGAVLAVAVALGEDLEQVAAALANVMHVSGRMSPRRSRTGGLVIDDTYNASPASVDRAIDSLAAIEGNGKKFLFLGDMLELGDLESEHHQLVIERVAQAKFDVLVVCGSAMRAALDRSASPAAGVVHRFETSEQAAELARSLIEQGLMGSEDVALVKGSRGMRMERIVAELAEEPSDSEEQGP